MVKATVFTVISPLDNANPGTLRWALTQAASNGTLTLDTILFAIPSAAQNTHVILLNSELPLITSNVMIDGTSQNGPTFGTSDARIAITPLVFQNCKRGFVMKNAVNIQIYGFLFAGFINTDPTVNETFSDAIFMWNVAHVRIGGVGRGNSFTGDYWAIRHQAIPDDPRNPPPGGIGNDIIIQSNVIGKNQTGRPLTRVGVVNGISLYDCSNVTIGGQQEEINTFMVFLNAINLGLNAITITDTSLIKILGNRFDPATSVPPLPFPLPLLGIGIIENNPQFPGLHLVEIRNNDIEVYTSGITLEGLKHPFIIAGNIINLDRRNNLFPSSLGISIIACDSGKIGGINALNEIHDTKNFGIRETGSKYINISRNSIYCTPKGISITSPAIAVPQITDLIIDPSLVASGKTCNGCKVEVFNTAACNNQIYNGQTYAASIFADNSGNFTYSGSLSCNTSFTTTRSELTTSEFYTPYNFIVDTSGMVIQDASCGRLNGSITGVHIFSGVDFTWQDQAGNVVGTDTNLVNLGPGFYRLVGTKQNLNCTLTTGFYEIKNVQPLIDLSSLHIIQPSDCGGLGSITNINILGGPPNDFNYKWKNASNNVVGTSLNLLNAVPGIYTLTVSVIADTTCSTSAGPFTLINEPAPAMDTTGISITNSTCGLSNGAISGLVIHNPLGVQRFFWKNFQGVVMGNGINLSNVPTGKYRLLYKDDAPCDTLRSAWFNIINQGLISIDESTRIIQPGGCTISNGSISNITISGAGAFRWVSLPAYNVVGNSPDLTNVPSGDYILIVSDPVNGCIDSTGVIHIPTSVIQTVTLGGRQVTDETCTASNGSVQVSGISPSTGYAFKWVKNSTDTFSNTLNISHISAGDYELIAIDSNGCSQQVTQLAIIDHPGPKINYLQAGLISDTCDQHIGAIKQITIGSGQAPINYKWSDGSTLYTTLLPELYNVGQGNYFLMVSDANGCADTTGLFHIANVTPVLAEPQYNDIYAKRNTTAFLKLKNPQIGLYHIFDNPGAVNQYDQNTTGNFVTPVLRNDMDFYINLQKGACFTPLSKVHITVIDYSKIYTPNSFTPNGDNLNDLFSIKVFGKITIDYFEIYNRWGKRVFRTKDIGQGWDGKTNNINNPPGVYVWILQGYDVDGSVLNLKGSVLLMR